MHSLKAPSEKRHHIIISHTEIFPNIFPIFLHSNEPQTALGEKLDGPAVLLKGPEE